MVNRACDLTDDPPGEALGPLLGYVARRLQTELQIQLRALGLRARHVIALSVLRDFGERSQSELTEALKIHATRTVALLNELESQGLAERRRSPHDRRRHSIAITQAGCEQLAKCEQISARLESKMFDLDAGQRTKLHKLLVHCAVTAAGSSESPAADPLAVLPN
jgi:DNA-binding MarR family transcriptional regulator